MERGVMAYADGSSSTFRRGAGSTMVEVEARNNKGEGHRDMLAHGFFLVSGGSFDPHYENASYAMTHDVPPESLPVPGPGLRITVDLLPPGMLPSRDRDVYVTGPLATTTVEGCAFSAFEVTRSTTSRSLLPGEEGATTRTGAGSVYLTDLGIKIETWVDTGDGGRFDLPAPTSIAAVR